MKLRAELLPLTGKYYGSRIALKNEDGRIDDQIVIWIMGDCTPSERELAGHDEAEYGPYEVCDSHFESTLGYEVCKLIVEAINERFAAPEKS